jgi:hypothetical protein
VARPAAQLRRRLSSSGGPKRRDEILRRRLGVVLAIAGAASCRADRAGTVSSTCDLAVRYVQVEEY